MKMERKKNSKAAIILLNIIAVVVIASSMSSYTSHQSITPYALNNEQGEWKNLKVLPHDITKDSLMGLMRGYNKALGVKCVYCHVPKKKEKKLNLLTNENKKKK